MGLANAVLTGATLTSTSKLSKEIFKLPLKNPLGKELHLCYTFVHDTKYHDEVVLQRSQWSLIKNWKTLNYPTVPSKICYFIFSNVRLQRFWPQLNLLSNYLTKANPSESTAYAPSLPPDIFKSSDDGLFTYIKLFPP